MKIPVIPARECGTCTKCCEGTVHGQVFGEPFYKGRPCSFCLINQGCSVYEQRPDDPCRTFKCSWLVDDSIPEWMKPNLSNAIITIKSTKSFDFPVLIPSSDGYSVDVVSWFILWGLPRYGHVVWYNKEGSRYYLGTPEFGAELAELDK